MVHELKLCKRFYDAVASGAKTYEVRKNDRGFQVGDALILRAVTDDDTRAYIPELDPISAEISYMLNEGGWGIENGYCVLALKNVHVNNSQQEKETMDNKTTIDKLKVAVAEFVRERDWDKYQTPKDIAIDIVNEASELLEIFVWKTETDMKEMLGDAKKLEHIREELADVLYAVCLFASHANIDLATAFYDKLDKTAKKYPVAKCKGRNKKYTEL